MPQVGFEPMFAGGERPYTYALDRAATGSGYIYIYVHIYVMKAYKGSWIRSSIHA